MAIETLELESQALALIDEAKDLAIVTPEDLLAADRYLSRNKTMQRAWEEFTQPSVDAANKAADAARSVRDRIIKPLKEFEATIKGKMATWKRNEDLKRIEAERKANEEARLAAAVDAEQAGDKEQAEAIIDTGAMVPPVIFPAVKPAGVRASFKKEWKYVIENPNLVPRDYLMIDTKKIGQVVSAMKEQTKIPGVRVYSEDVVAARR